jgi:hypothetical protein
MTWITISEIHRCELPKYEHDDRRHVGTLWRCDDEKCNLIWRLISASAMQTSNGWVGNYRFTLLDRDEIQHWR